MKTLRAAIVLAVIGLILSIWLLVQVSWYTFFAFMFVAQPLLLVALLIFAGSALKHLRQKGVL